MFNQARLWSFANRVTSDHLCGFLQKYVALSACDVCKLARVYWRSVGSVHIAMDQSRVDLSTA